MVLVLYLFIHNKSLADLSRIFTKTLQFRFSSESPKLRTQQKKPTDFDQGRGSVGCKMPNNLSGNHFTWRAEAFKRSALSAMKPVASSWL